MVIFLDIETIRCQRNVDHILIDKISKSVKKDETREKYLEELRAKTSLDGGYGEIVCIGWAQEDEDVTIHGRDKQGAECDLLEEFFDAMQQVKDASHGRAIHFCGHNIQWDLKFIWQRSVVNGLTPTVKLPWRESVWSGHYIDTMYLWSGLHDRISLKNLCEILGIKYEDDIDGSQVWDSWEKENYIDIISHCISDVKRVQEIYRRLK